MFIVIEIDMEPNKKYDNEFRAMVDIIEPTSDANLEDLTAALKFFKRVARHTSSPGCGSNATFSETIDRALDGIRNNEIVAQLCADGKPAVAKPSNVLDFEAPPDSRVQ